jgi:hypothetical protein
MTKANNVMSPKQIKQMLNEYSAAIEEFALTSLDGDSNATEEAYDHLSYLRGWILDALGHTDDKDTEGKKLRQQIKAWRKKWVKTQVRI